jgi:very-short-patch-repair endonuclease
MECYNYLMPNDLSQSVLQIVQEKGPLSVRQIVAHLPGNVEMVDVNSLLYGQLRNFVVRDKDEDGYPTWRIKTKQFEASKGLEVLFYDELLRQGIVTPENSYLGYGIKNRRNGKTYDLDIAVMDGDLKLDIEIDGFEHMRADARLSMQKQIEKNGENCDIEIDWMDNKTSFVNFNLLEKSKVFRWCTTHRAWCIRYHEELLKPHDITRNVWLIESGWKVIRFWNFEVKDELERCLDQTRDLLSA